MNMPEQKIIDTSARTDVLVWWLSQDECEAIGDELADDAPAYLCLEYRSRLGRPGRGRLWVDDQFDDVGIPWDTTKPASRLAGERGGIVIWASDAAHVFSLPGFLTDCRLNFINEWEPHP